MLIRIHKLLNKSITEQIENPQSLWLLGLEIFVANVEVFAVKQSIKRSFMLKKKKRLDYTTIAVFFPLSSKPWINDHTGLINIQTIFSHWETVCAQSKGKHWLYNPTMRVHCSKNDKWLQKDRIPSFSLQIPWDSLELRKKKKKPPKPKKTCS